MCSSACWRWPAHDADWAAERPRWTALVGFVELACPCCSSCCSSCYPKSGSDVSQTHRSSCEYSENSLEMCSFSALAPECARGSPCRMAEWRNSLQLLQLSFVSHYCSPAVCITPTSVSATRAWIASKAPCTSREHLHISQPPHCVTYHRLSRPQSRHRKRQLLPCNGTLGVRWAHGLGLIFFARFTNLLPELYVWSGRWVSRPQVQDAIRHGNDP